MSTQGSRFDGKVAFITGGGTGIGRATALRLENELDGPRGAGYRRMIGLSPVGQRHPGRGRHPRGVSS